MTTRTKAALTVLGAGALGLLAGFLSGSMRISETAETPQALPSKTTRPTASATSGPATSGTVRNADTLIDEDLIRWLRVVSNEELREAIIANPKEFGGPARQRLTLMLEVLMTRDGEASYTLFKEKQTEHPSQFHMAMSAWAKQHPERVITVGLQALSAENPTPLPVHPLSRAFQHLAQSDPDRAMTLVAEVPKDTRRRASILTALLQGMIITDPGRATDLAQQLLESGEIRGLHFLGPWAQLDPEAATDWLMQQDPHLKKDHSLPVLSQLVATNPQRAMALTLEIHGLSNQGRHRVASNLTTWMTLDLDAAIAWTSQHIAADEQDAVLNISLTQWARISPMDVAARMVSGDPIVTRNLSWTDLVGCFARLGMEKEALALQDSVPDEDAQDFAQALATAGLLEPAPADLMRSLRDGTGKAGMAWALRRPDELEAEFQQLPAPERESVFNTLARNLTNYDPERILKLAAHLEDPEHSTVSRHIEALAGFATVDPVKAAGYALRMPEGETRESAIATVVVNWFNDDPARAEAWFEEHRESLSEPVERTVRYTIKPP